MREEAFRLRGNGKKDEVMRRKKEKEETYKLRGGPRTNLKGVASFHVGCFQLP
jgi:hypothetical protein